MGILGPKDLSPEIKSYLVKATEDVSKSAELKAFARKTGNYVEFFSDEAFARRMIEQRDLLAPVVKSLGLSAEN